MFTILSFLLSESDGIPLSLKFPTHGVLWISTQSEISGLYILWFKTWLILSIFMAFDPV